MTALITSISTAGLLHVDQDLKPRSKKVYKTAEDKRWWSDGYANWDDAAFKKRLRISRRNFQMLLYGIAPIITKTPTNAVPNPIEAHRQLGLAIYRLAHGCTFTTLSDLFGVSISVAEATFNVVIRELIKTFYDRFVRMPRGDEWIQETIGFIENYGFPCIAAWDGFHVYPGTSLKQYYSFKKRYSINNMGLISYNKRFLSATVNAPGSTHDARLLRHSAAFLGITDGQCIPDKTIHLGEKFGEIPLVTIGDSAFPRHSWLLKCYNENTKDEKERLFNDKLRSARVVTENCYGMFKGRWRILYKKMDAKLHNVKYITLTCIMLHNLCIETDDPCHPRWKLKVKNLELQDKIITRTENKHESMQVSNSIKEWLWQYA